MDGKGRSEVEAGLCWVVVTWRNVRFREGPMEVSPLRRSTEASRAEDPGSHPSSPSTMDCTLVLLVLLTTISNIRPLILLGHCMSPFCYDSSTRPQARQNLTIADPYGSQFHEVLPQIYLKTKASLPRILEETDSLSRGSRIEFGEEHSCTHVGDMPIHAGWRCPTWSGLS